METLTEYPRHSQDLPGSEHVDHPAATDRSSEEAASLARQRPGVPDAVAIERLTKRYGRRVAVDDLSFTVPTGSVAGLIGPNGAGKTTLMAMLLGLVRPTSGEGHVLGQPIDEPGGYLRRVGASIEGPAFHGSVSGYDNLRALALLGGHNTDEIPALMDQVGLNGRGDDAYGSYSLGMKQRLGIAASLLGNPELVILDEPTNGLDPRGMQDMRRLIGDISVDDRTIIVSSHLLSELEQVCDWLIVIDHGGLVFLGPPEGLRGTESLVLRTADPSQLPQLRQLAVSTGLPVGENGAEVTVTLDEQTNPAHIAAHINRMAHDGGVVLSELHHQRADLEARYLDLIAQGSTTATTNTATTSEKGQS